MGLTDRLAAAQRARTENQDAPQEKTPATTTTKAAPRTGRVQPRDPFEDVKRVVHAQLVASLGPKLYDVHMTQSELESNVRLALQGAVAATAPASRRRSRTTSSATARSSRCCATETSPRSWSTRST